LRVNQTGSGSSFLVEDSTNPDSTPFIVDASGNVGIGIAIPASVNGNASKILEISGALNTILNFNNTTVNNSGILEFSRTGRTPISRYAQIQVSTDASDNGSIVFNTALAGADITEKLRIDQNGNIGVGASTFGTSAVKVIGIANGTAPSSSPAGMGQLYVEGGALKYRGSSGTITTIANA
jgi:hypothetical protein